MGRVEISDGVTTRRIPVREFRGVIRIDVTGNQAVVEVSEDVAVFE